jgi:hypothetical protein
VVKKRPATPHVLNIIFAAYPRYIGTTWHVRVGQAQGPRLGDGSMNMLCKAKTKLSTSHRREDPIVLIHSVDDTLHALVNSVVWAPALLSTDPTL